MKVLGLVASPRKNGNSEILVKAMLASLPAETEKQIIRLPDLRINPCNACYACLPEEKSCVIKDDLAFVLEKIKEADAVIIGSACYYLGPHTSVKAINDRLLSVLGNGRDFAGKKCVTAIVYGIPGWEGWAREGLNNFARFLHLEVVGTMTVQAANPGEAVEPQVLAEAAELAARLVSAAPADTALAGINTCRDCGSSLLQIATDGSVCCVMCGLRGTLRPDSAGCTVDFPTGGHTRFTPESMSEHCRLLENIKQRYLAGREELSRRRKPYLQYNNWWIEPPRT